MEDLLVRGGSGGTPLSTNKSYYGGSIPFLSISDISKSNKRIIKTEKNLTMEGLNNSAAWLVPKESISLAMYASVGKVAILGIDAATSQAFYNMLFDDLDLRDFVYQRLKKASDNAEWHKLISTGTQQNLNAQKVKKFRIDFPKRREEQAKIGSFLEKLDNLITLHQRKLELLIQLKKAYLQRLFPRTGQKLPEIRFANFQGDWQQCKLENVLTERSFLDYKSEKFPLVSFTVEKGVTQKVERYEREQLVRGEKAKKIYKVTKYDDIVYNPANLKFGAISRNKFGNAVFSPIYITFDVNFSLTSPEYVESFVTRRNFIQRALKFQQGTVYERQSVNPESLLKMLIDLPQKEEQCSICKLYNVIAICIEKETMYISSYTILKNTFLKFLFV